MGDLNDPEVSPDLMTPLANFIVSGLIPSDIAPVLVFRVNSFSVLHKDVRILAQQVPTGQARCQVREIARP